MVQTLTGLLFLMFVHFARFSRSRFVPSRHYSGASLFACACFGFARSGHSAETAKSLCGTIQFLIHGINIRKRLRICKNKVKLFLHRRLNEKGLPLAATSCWLLPASLPAHRFSALRIITCGPVFFVPIHQLCNRLRLAPPFCLSASREQFNTRGENELRL